MCERGDGNVLGLGERSHAARTGCLWLPRKHCLWRRMHDPGYCAPHLPLERFRREQANC